MTGIQNKKIRKSKSSSAWLQRQMKDPYVLRAAKEGYRSRATYKLVELNEKFRFLRDGQAVVDLGSAPGGWSQFIGREYPRSRVIAMDLLEMDPLPNVIFYRGDFTSDEALEWLNNQVGPNSIDVVLSDMAPNTTGHQRTDHIRQMVLLEYAFDFAKSVLKNGGTFVAKSFTGGTTVELLAEIRKNFTSIKHVKPASSRKESVEMFIVATGFKGA